MSYFYKKDYMKIKKGKKKFTFFMEINMNDSFTRILWDRVALRYFKVIKQTTEDGYKKLEVKAKTIESLKSYLKKKDLEYDLVLKLMYNVATQIFLLKQIDKGITHFSLDDILIIDERKFVFVNSEKITKIKFKKLVLNKIIKKNKFVSPELEDVDEIPSEIHYKASIFSLALISMYALTGNYVTLENFKDLTDFMYATKLYWCLERCLKIDPDDRYFYII